MEERPENYVRLLLGVHGGFVRGRRGFSAASVGRFPVKDR